MDSFTTPENEDGRPETDYENLHCWDENRLVETHRRLSHDLRRWGFDEQTVHRMGRIEGKLRDRGLDPDAIAREVERAHS